MRKCIFAMALAVGYITGCGGGTPISDDSEDSEASSNEGAELAQANSESGESTSELSEAPTSSLEGVWQTTYGETLLNDGVDSSDCVEVTSFYRDYTWYRVSLNNISSGFYIVDSEATADVRGLISLTATSNNELTSCNAISDIQVGATTTRYFDEPTDEGTSFYAESDVLADPIGKMIKDEIATAALLNPSSFDMSVMDSVDENTGYQEALTTLFERQDKTYPPEPSIETVEASKTGIDTDQPVVPTDSEVATEPEITTESEVATEPEITTESEVASEPEITTESEVATEPEITTESEVIPEIEIPAETPTETIPELPIVVVTEPEFISQIEMFSVNLRCSSCPVEEFQLSWESETTGLEKLELFFDNDAVRTLVATLDPDDYSALNNISSSLDLIEQESGCFDVVSTDEEGLKAYSPQTCVGIREVN